MSLSTTATFQPVISETLNAIGEQRFVGTQVLPVREVATKNGDYPVWTADNFDNDAAKQRAPGSLIAEIDFSYGEQSYKTLQYALKAGLPDEDRSKANDDGISDPEMSIAMMLQRNLMIAHERRVAALMTAAGFNGTAATAAMSATTTAKPIQDIQNAVERLNANGFYDNLALIIETSLFNELINTDDVRGIFNGNGQYTNEQILANAFGVSQVIKLPTRYNSAAKGKTAVRTKVWETDEYFVGQVVGGDFANGGFGRTLAYGPDGGVFTAETYRDEDRKRDVLRVYHSVDEVIINTLACEKITGA